ncbi:hypothetical protein [Hymenobacter siberiensis]|uniref:hypothetical protein n=1 Tax=Hymenobacter siberiensis TaxID=2848396 RepID=UPI001C1E50DE|nr:hypothetical protein [Hymenobacter siberiensis]
MNLFRTLRGIAFFGLAGAGLSGCLSAPSYSNTPEIEFRDVKVTRIPAVNGNVGRDTLEFVLGFRDGDGDLGLGPEDLARAPFNTKTGGHNNRGYSYNYFIQPYKKNAVTKNFDFFVTPAQPPFPAGIAGEYDSQYPRLNGADGRAAPLKGELRYKLPLSLDGTVFAPGQVFRFEISILDRGLHESNKITTSEVTL